MKGMLFLVLGDGCESWRCTRPYSSSSVSWEANGSREDCLLKGTTNTSINIYWRAHDHFFLVIQEGRSGRASGTKKGKCRGFTNTFPSENTSGRGKMNSTERICKRLGRNRDALFASEWDAWKGFRHRGLCQPQSPKTQLTKPSTQEAVGIFPIKV